MRDRAVRCTKNLQLNSMLVGRPLSNMTYKMHINPLNAELNPICYLLALLTLWRRNYFFLNFSTPCT